MLLTLLKTQIVTQLSHLKQLPSVALLCQVVTNPPVKMMILLGKRCTVGIKYKVLTVLFIVHTANPLQMLLALNTSTGMLHCR